MKKTERVVITYDDISDDLTKDENQRKWFGFAESIDNGIEIPIALEGAGNVISLKLGGNNNTKHNVLIAGTVIRKKYPAGYDRDEYHAAL